MSDLYSPHKLHEIEWKKDFERSAAQKVDLIIFNFTADQSMAYIFQHRSLSCRHDWGMQQLSTVPYYVKVQGQTYFQFLISVVYFKPNNYYGVQCKLNQSVA